MLTALLAARNILGESFEVGRPQGSGDRLGALRQRNSQVGTGIPQAHVIRHHDDDIRLGGPPFFGVRLRDQDQEAGQTQ